VAVGYSAELGDILNLKYSIKYQTTIIKITPNSANMAYFKFEPRHRYTIQNENQNGREKGIKVSTQWAMLQWTPLSDHPHPAKKYANTREKKLKTNPINTPSI